MILLMDMGTSNTRLFLFDGQRVLDTEKGAFGAGSTLSEGRAFLETSVKALIGTILSRNNLAEDAISCIVASGMASSELGIAEVPHLAAPATLSDLVEGLETVKVDAITEIPFRIVPGVRKNNADGEIEDMMRGEETETFGICDLMGIEGNAVLVLPGSHNKVLALDENGAICDFVTCMSGEMMSAVSGHTILRGAVSYDYHLDEHALREGAAFAKEMGLGAALFRVRVLTKRSGANADAISSFFSGAVLSADAELAKGYAKQGRTVYVGGKESLRHALAVLIGSNVQELPDEVSGSAVSHGLSLICKKMK